MTNAQNSELAGGMPKTIDNVSCRLGDDIACFLKPEATVSISSNGFSLSAFERLADELESVKAVRFVFTAPAFVPQDAVREKIRKERREFYIPGVGEASVFGTEYEIRLRNRLMQKAVAKRCGQWIKKGNVKFMFVAAHENPILFVHPRKSSYHSADSSHRADISRGGAETRRI